MRTLALAATLLTMVLSSPALAAPPTVLKVSVVHATKGKGATTVDPKLKKIGKALRQAFAGYSNFKRLASHKLTLDPQATVTLPGGRSAVFTHKGTKGKDVKLNFAIPKSKVDVDLTSRPGRVFVQAGLRHDKGILILALYLRPPKK